LADCLSHLREEAVRSVSPQLFSVATLTGHVGRSFGPYTAAMENAPAVASGVGAGLHAASFAWGDPVEISRLRREDYQAIAPKNSTHDIRQVADGAAPSRGHQYPAVFLQYASGLAQHGRDSAHPLPYTHLDVAGAAVEEGYVFGQPSATPLVALTARYVLHK